MLTINYNVAMTFINNNNNNNNNVYVGRHVCLDTVPGCGSVLKP